MERDNSPYRWGEAVQCSGYVLPLGVGFLLLGRVGLPGGQGQTGEVRGPVKQVPFGGIQLVLEASGRTEACQGHLLSCPPGVPRPGLDPPGQRCKKVRRPDFILGQGVWLSSLLSRRQSGGSSRSGLGLSQATGLRAQGSLGLGRQEAALRRPLGM